ncbi:MAG: phosphoenolpyruvate carboxykinase (ATP) [Exilispira sp.]
MEERVEKLISKLNKNNVKVNVNLERRSLIEKCIEKKEVFILKTGTLSSITPSHSTGRSPKDTVTVKRSSNEETLDWDSQYNIPITLETFEMLYDDAINFLLQKDEVFLTVRNVGADPSYSLTIYSFSSKALNSLFTLNMFRPYNEYSESVFYNKSFLLLMLPDDYLNSDKYKGKLRINPETGKTTQMAIAINYEDRIGIIIGSSYLGTCKKLIFTVMNYYLVFHNILPLHCSANEGVNQDIALFLGLSGTGKTTLSTSSDRKLLGDDEHGWSDNGIANFEYGCYAKLVNLDPIKEPEIYNACFRKTDPLDHGAIVENVMTYPDGSFDLFDIRLTENSRGSYPLSFIPNIKESGIGGHPSVIIFLTADANGVLPPISKLTIEQALLWYLMGYTSKLAGTETGIKEPQSTFSPFFGAPFMPAAPKFYIELLQKKLQKFNTDVYLINTGWTGGSYGSGKRIPLSLTRTMVRAAINGELKNIFTEEDNLFHLQIPTSCPGIENSSLLHPESTWKDKSSFKLRATKLAEEFSSFYDKMFKGKGIPKIVEDCCPGK